MIYSDISPENITLAHIKAKINDISKNIETLSLPTAELHAQLRDIKKWQTRMLNIISSESATIYSQLHNLDPDILFNSLSADNGANSFSLPHEKQIYGFLLSQINTIYHSVNTINTQFNTEYDATALPLLQGGFQSIFGTTTLPTAEQLKDVELSSSERFILNELQRVISAVVNTLTEGLSYAQLVDTRTTVSQRIYDLSKIIHNPKKDLKHMQDQMQEVSNAQVLLPELREFNNRISTVLLHWLQSVSQYEPYLSQNVPLPGLDSLILAHRRYFSVFIGMA